MIVAVLPGDNCSGDRGQRVSGRGFHRGHRSARQLDPAHIGVIGRTSMMAYKRTTKSLSDIGRVLDAEFLVESSLRTEAGRLRIMSNLIRASDQAQIWSAAYEPRSVLEFQRDLSMTIAHEVQLHVSPQRMTALERRQPRQVKAYDLYFRGRYLWNSLRPDDAARPRVPRSRNRHRSHYALAWAGLAAAYAASPINGDAPPSALWAACPAKRRRAPRRSDRTSPKRTRRSAS